MDQINNIDFCKMNTEEFIAYLKTISTPQKQEFDKKLIPDTPYLLGAKIPDLRKIASKILLGDYEAFLKNVSSSCHEAMIVRGVVVARCKKRDAYLDDFADSIYNWAICDTVASSFTRPDDALYRKLLSYLKSEKPFTVRLGITGLLNAFLTEKGEEILEALKEARCEAKTTRYAAGWLLSAAYVKFPERTETYLTNGSFDQEIVKIAFSKIRDSYRVSREDTARLRQILFSKDK